MTFLPIADRELRVSARRHFTYWSRVVVAAILMFIFGSVFLGTEMASATPFSPGVMTFNILKWIVFVFACSAGIFLTSDSLSEEKREGTLGLLFLTDLRGYDVVLGKLLSQSLQSFYGLLAAFPILALPLLMGGVTGVEFGRSMLVICNTLFFSVSVGIFVSSISREVLKAMNATALITLLVFIGLPWMDTGLAHWKGGNFKAILSIVSPGYLFYAQAGFGPSAFRVILAVQHCVAWSFLALACFCAPRAWQEKSVSDTGLRRRMMGLWRFGSRSGRLKLRQKLLSENPVLWLAIRDLWLSRMVLLITVAATIFQSLQLYNSWDSVRQGFLSSSFSFLIAPAMLLWVASQSTRLFVDGVRNGSWELILVTSLPPRQIFQGQLNALFRIFLIPLILLFCARVGGQIQTIHWMNHVYTKSQTPGFSPMYETQQIARFVCSQITWIGDVVATACLGMWMGLTSRKISAAVFKTIFLVILLPWFGEIFVQLFSFRLIASTGNFLRNWNLSFWLGIVMACVFELSKNIFLVVWSRRKLVDDLREMVARNGHGYLPRVSRMPRTRATLKSVPQIP